MNGIDFEANKEAIERVVEIDKKIKDENPNGMARTRLMYEQLLRGLYINQLNVNNF